MFSIFKRKPRGPKPFEIWDYPDLDALARSGAAFVRGMAQLAFKQRGLFRLCISAAPDVLALCRMLPQGTRQNELDWQALHLFFAWEQCSEDQGCLALERTREALLEAVPIPGGNLHPLPAADNEQQALALWEEDLARHFQSTPSQGPPPFDMLLLDVGPDGRLGGLAPGDPALEDASRWAAPLLQGGVGLPLPALEGAANALLLATGQNAADLVARARRPDPAFRQLPVGAFTPKGRRVWLTDAAT